MRSILPKKQQKFWDEAGLNPNQTPEEKYIDSVNKCVDDRINISKVYDHKEFVKLNKEKHLKIYKPVGGKVAPRKEGLHERIIEPSIPDLITLGIFVTAVILFMLDLNII